jgi:hypothetical protein
MKKGPGRPRLAKNKAKGTTLQIRLTASEREQIKKIALRDGNKKPSQWAREKILALLPG